MSRVPPEDGGRRRGPGRLSVRLAAAAVAVVAGVSLVVQAVRSSSTVSGQSAPVVVHDAALDNAFYDCLDRQAHSVVRPGESVTLSTSNLADVITLIKGVGSWVTVADPPSSAQVVLTLRTGHPGPGTCLGTVVVATSTGPGGRPVVRIGHGAQVPGTGPPPAPPL